MDNVITIKTVDPVLSEISFFLCINLGNYRGD